MSTTLFTLCAYQYSVEMQAQPKIDASYLLFNTNYFFNVSDRVIIKMF
jgi:hypothetical protein